MSKISIIGAGNMGRAIVEGLLHANYPVTTITVSDLNSAKLQQLQRNFAIQVTSDNQLAIQGSDVVILAVKPQAMLKVLRPLVDEIQQQPCLLISIVAGAMITAIQQCFSLPVAIVRCMPNTPVLIQQGMSALFAGPFVTKQQSQQAQAIFTTIGKSVWLNTENEMHAITAISGSGPAHFFLLFAIFAKYVAVEAILQQFIDLLSMLIDDSQLDLLQLSFPNLQVMQQKFIIILQLMLRAALSLGVEQGLTQQCVLQTAYGAALLAKSSEQSLEQLQINVTSKGGTTAAALQVMQQQQLSLWINQLIQADTNLVNEKLVSIFTAAYTASSERSIELARSQEV